MMKEIIKKKVSKRNTGDIQNPTMRIQKSQRTQLKRKTTQLRISIQILMKTKLMKLILKTPTMKTQKS